jgi:hypothetical protein
MSTPSSASAPYSDADVWTSDRPQGRVSDVAFTKEAKRVVSVSADVAQVFDCDACVDDVVAPARSRVSRVLTNEERAKYLGQ